MLALRSKFDIQSTAVQSTLSSTFKTKLGECTAMQSTFGCAFKTTIDELDADFTAVHLFNKRCGLLPKKPTFNHFGYVRNEEVADVAFSSF